MAARTLPPLSEAEKIALRSTSRATPQPVTRRCPACGGAVNSMTDECRGCSD